MLFCGAVVLSDVMFDVQARSSLLGWPDSAMAAAVVVVVVVVGVVARRRGREVFILGGLLTPHVNSISTG